MNEEKIAELKAQREALFTQLKALRDADEKAFGAWLRDNAITTMKPVVRPIGGRYDWGYEVEALDPKTGYGLFATDVRVRYEVFLWGDKPAKITFNTGSSGSFGMDDAGQVFKYKLLTALMERASELEEMAKAFSAKHDPVMKEYCEVDAEIRDLERTNQQAEYEAKRDEVIAGLAPGSWLVNAEATTACLVTKITKKMVYFKRYSFTWTWSDTEHKTWVNGDTGRSHAWTKNYFAHLLIEQGWQVKDKPQGVNP